MVLSLSRFVLHLLVIVVICISQSKAAEFKVHPQSLEFPSRIHSHAAGIYNDIFTIMAGIMINGNSGQQNVWSYSISLNPYSDTWTQNGDVTTPIGTTRILVRSDSSVQVGNLVYMINPEISGGTVSNIYENVLFIYDLAANDYKQTYSQPLYKAGEVCMVYNSNNNLLYVIGGETEGPPDPNDPFGMNSVIQIQQTQTYDITNDVWSEVAKINVARSDAGCSMDATNNNIFLFGGKTAESYNFNGIEKYSVSNDLWEILPVTMINGATRIECILFPVDNNIYCIGSSQVLVFDPITSNQNMLSLNSNKGAYFSVSLWNDNCIIVAGGEGNMDGTIEYFGDECNWDLCDGVTCEYGDVCDSNTGQCVRDCDHFAIDEYLTECSAEFEDHDNEISTLSTRIDGNDQNIIDLNTNVNTINVDITQIMAEIDAINTRIDGFRPRGKRANAMSVVYDTDNGINHNSSHLSLWQKYKDAFIVILLSANLIIMFYGYCCSKNKKMRYDSVKYLDSEEFDESEANAINLQ